MAPPQRLTLQQLQAMGGKPAPAQAAPRLTLAQLQNMGATPALPPPKVGVVEAGLRGFNQGATLGWADELLGAMESRFPSLRQSPGDVLADLVYPETIPAARRTVQAPTYEQARDAQRSLEKESRAQQPVAYIGGELGGGFATSRVLPAGFASNVTQGAVQGLGDSTANDAGGLAADTAIGAAFGAGGDLAGRALGKYVLPGAMSRARGFLENVAERQGRRALENSSNTLRNAVPTSREAILQALQDKAIRIFGTADSALENLEKLAKRRGEAYGSILRDLEANGVQGPEAAAIAEELTRKAEAALRVSGANEAVPNLYRQSAEKVLERPDPGFSMSERGLTGPRQTRLGLDQTEKTKRNLQKEAKLDRTQRTGLDETRADIARVYRRRIEEVIKEAGESAEPGSEVAELADEFVPIKRVLSRTLEAKKAAERGASRGANRSAIGLGEQVMMAGEQGLGAKALMGLAVNQAKQRGASTVADLAYRGSQKAGNVVREAITNPRTTQDWMARLAAVPLRQRLLIEALRNNPPPTTQQQ